MDAVGELGGLRLDAERRIDEIGPGYTYFADGDVVVAKITPCFENGKAALAEGLINGVAFGTTELHVIRPLDAMDARYLFYVVTSEAFRRHGEASMYGAGGQKRVPDSFIKDLFVDVPPLPEQRAIAAFLDERTARIDALIAKKRRLLELLAEKRRAVITRAVTRGLDPTVPLKDTGIPWLGQVPAHWECGVQLRFVASPVRWAIVNGPFGSDLLTTELYDEGVPVIYSGEIRDVGYSPKIKKHVTPEKAEDLRFCRVNPGELLVAKVGDPPGTAAVYPDDLQPAIVTQDVVRIVLDQKIVCGDYCRALINSQVGRAEIELTLDPATRGRFSLFSLKRIHILKPPLQEQIQIVESIRVHEERFISAAGSLNRIMRRLAEYRSALITAAVTGKLDVARAVAAEPEIAA